MEFERIYNVLLSLFLLGLGIHSLLYREWAIKVSERGFKHWYKKTGFSLFKFQAENMDSTYMRMVSVLVGVIFIIVGLQMLIHNIR
ncbi:MAG: hypothetical protein NTZ13_01050 [Candidatus Parcubacteria bacterium]|nr:hypothetical protein [Candidatus Parcubacteria bacterium]